MEFGGLVWVLVRTSFCSQASNAGGPLKLGERVIVASATTGTKTGTLRYVGPTDFAAGEWAGVELDGPLGKGRTTLI